MDDKSNELLQELVNQQKKQTDLLQQNLGRIRFSLRGLLILMTLMALGLGYLGYKQQQGVLAVPTPGGTFYAPAFRQPYASPAPPSTVPAQPSSTFIDPLPTPE